jgi:hypothetical protein
MDSSVIAALFVASKSIEERDGRLELVIPPDAHILQRVANIAGLARSVPIHETRNAALASIQPKE